MKKSHLSILIAALALSACKGKSDAEPPPLPSTAAAAAPPAATAAAAPAAAGADIPTPEDYEQQAIDQINPQNIDSELDKLEKEIGQ